MPKTPRDWNGYFDEIEARWMAETGHEQYDGANLVIYEGIPIKAFGCSLPDGSKTVAVCLTRGEGLTATERVWCRPLPGTRLHRRGRLDVAANGDLHFIDDASADLPGDAAGLVHPKPKLEEALILSPRIRALTRGSQLFARLLNEAHCAGEWLHGATGTRGWLTGREAGRIVAWLRGEGDYLDWYPADSKEIDEMVAAELNALGWQPAEDPPVDPVQDPISRA